MKRYNDMKNSELANELVAYLNGNYDGQASAIDEFDKLVRICAGRLKNFDNMKKANAARRFTRRRRAPRQEGTGGESV